LFIYLKKDSNCIVSAYFHVMNERLSLAANELYLSYQVEGAGGCQ